MKKIKTKRIIISISLLCILCFSFFLRLFQFQIVQGEYFSNIALESLSYTTSIEAKRGEITDRNGEFLATSRMQFNLVFYKPFIKSENENELILKIAKIFLDNNFSWIDSLPINIKNNEFIFSNEDEQKINALKSNLKLNEYASAENIMSKLIKEYKLENYTKEQQRILSAVKYEMTQRNYSNANPYTFAKDIPLNLVIIIKENSIELKGIDIIVTPVRFYPNGDIAPHIIGNIGLLSKEEYDELKSKGYGYNDMIGKQGIEKIFEEYLKGTPGKREVIRNNVGEIIDVAVTKEPIPGNNIILTIDSKLQRTSEKLLEKYITNFQKTRAYGKGGDATSGSIVVMDVNTGQVLSLATYPSYNLNDYKKDYTNLVNDKNNPLFNRATQGLYNPGSIYKPVMGVAGALSNLINENYTVNCTGVYTRFSDYKPRCLGVHGKTNLNKAIAVSCNVFFYEVGYQIGIENIDKVSKNFGLGQKTGIEIPELAGYVASPALRKERGQQWQVGDVVQAAIGQSDTMLTPLQMAVYTATIANGGTRYKPTLLKQIINSKGEVINENKSKVEYTFTNSNAIQLTKRAMLETTISASGSGRASFGNYPFQVGTKTGTPQAPTGSNNATFIAFGPYDNPQIAVSAVIEHGSEGYYIGPMVKEVFDAYFYNKHLE